MSDILHRLGRDGFDALEARASVHAPHLSGILQMVRHCGVQLLIIPQLRHAMSQAVANAKRPFIALVGDDAERSVGPDFFDRPSLDRFIGMADAAAVISSAARADVYNAVGSMAVLLARNVLIVETSLEQEIAWTKAIQRVSPCLPTIICTVKAPWQ